MRMLFSKRGITLIELLSTVVIIGIVATMAVPRMQKALDKVKAKTGNRDIVSVLKLARSMAITDKTPYGIYVKESTNGQTGNNSLILFKDLHNLSEFAFDDVDSIIRIDSLPSEFVYLRSNLTTQTIIFQPNGSVSYPTGALNTTQINIIAMVYTGDLMSIHENSILPSTGRVKSYSYYY